MTRALIADPDWSPRPPRARSDEIIACIGCNQGCIGHYHAGVPIGCVVNPRTGRERTLPRRAGGPRALRVLVSAAGRRASRRRSRPRRTATPWRCSSGRGDRRPAAARRPRAGARRAVAALAGERRAAARARRGRAAAGDARERRGRGRGGRVVLATGARPYVPTGRRRARPVRRRTGAAGVATVDAWTAIANPAARRGPVLVADWGGGWDGLDAAEVLAGRGSTSRSRARRPSPGQTLHQYQRNLYLARLDERGIEILHHTEVPATGLRHLFSGREQPAPRRRDDRLRPGPRARGRALGRARGTAGPRPRRRRARPALGRGGDARGRHRAPAARVATSVV